MGLIRLISGWTGFLRVGDLMRGLSVFLSNPACSSWRRDGLAVVSTTIDGKQTVGLFNPFHSFPTDLRVHRLRYMFTFRDMENGEQFHYGDVVVHPVVYDQSVELDLPVWGLVTILDGHDYYSHHRRFDMSIARPATREAMQSNFARYALDFVHIGSDGNTRPVPSEERQEHYDFRFPDAKRFYSHRERVYAPSAGEVVIAIDDRPDLYDSPFDLKKAVDDNRVHDLAGNYVVIQHNDREFSHLFHFLQDSLEVETGQPVNTGDPLGRIGFSGAATVYTHLHFQLMDGSDFLTANPLPARFRKAIFVRGDPTRGTHRPSTRHRRHGVERITTVSRTKEHQSHQSFGIDEPSSNPASSSAYWGRSTGA